MRGNSGGYTHTHTHTHTTLHSHAHALPQKIIYTHTHTPDTHTHLIQLPSHLSGCVPHVVVAGGLPLVVKLDAL
jgi:hypothetical protein